jgi:hypothetical protein
VPHASVTVIVTFFEVSNDVAALPVGVIDDADDDLLVDPGEQAASIRAVAATAAPIPTALLFLRHEIIGEMPPAGCCSMCGFMSPLRGWFLGASDVVRL